VTLSGGDVTVRTAGAGSALVANALVDGGQDLDLDIADTATFNAAVGTGAALRELRGTTLGTLTFMDDVTTTGDVSLYAVGRTSDILFGTGADFRSAGSAWLNAGRNIDAVDYHGTASITGNDLHLRAGNMLGMRAYNELTQTGITVDADNRALYISLGEQDGNYVSGKMNAGPMLLADGKPSPSQINAPGTVYVRPWDYSPNFDPNTLIQAVMGALRFETMEEMLKNASRADFFEAAKTWNYVKYGNLGQPVSDEGQESTPQR
jgi:hypothetical protein